jgi:hypothetical protein
MSITFSGLNHNEIHTTTFSDGKTVSYPATVHLCDDPEAEFDHPLWLNLANDNARAFLGLLGVTVSDESDLFGEMSLAEVRRAVMVARATFNRKAAGFTREEASIYGKPRDNGDGTVEMRPLRVHTAGLSMDRLARYIDRLADLTEALAEKGATHISWG